MSNERAKFYKGMIKINFRIVIISVEKEMEGREVKWAGLLL